MNFLSFGPADKDAATQMERCLGVSGDDAVGVLCADHHKGYGMPIKVLHTLRPVGVAMAGANEVDPYKD